MPDQRQPLLLHTLFDVRSSPGRLMTGVVPLRSAGPQGDETSFQVRQVGTYKVYPRLARMTRNKSREAPLNQSRDFLSRGRTGVQADPPGPGRDPVQARTAARSAENASGLLTGAVGGVVDGQLQRQTCSPLRAELAEIEAAAAAAAATAADGFEGSRHSRPRSKRVDASDRCSGPRRWPHHEQFRESSKQPAVWFAAAGWLLAIVLLFRRRSL